MSTASWELIVCGINHRTASVEDREPLQITREQLADAQVRFSELPGVMECVILSTCNRIEFCFVSDRTCQPMDIVARFYRQLRNRDTEPLADKCYVRSDREAAEHLFRVAAGVDSMVIGETQILGQLKDAYSSACTLKTTGRFLHRLYHQAFRVGKLVRSDTEMGRGACSVSSAAAEYLKTRMNEFDRPEVLFVGANHMIQLAASHISRLPVGNLVFANRTGEKATALAARYGVVGYPLEELPSLLSKTDIVVSCTGAEGAVISAAVLNDARSGLDRPLLCVDLAIPRDIEDPGSDAAVQVIDLDAIKKFVDGNRQKRQEAIPDAEVIIEQRLSEFMYWFSHARKEISRGVLDQSFEQIRRQELSRLLKKLPIELQSELHDASKHLVQKLLHVQSRIKES
jgi:glutamyl-tRNA reductase